MGQKGSNRVILGQKVSFLVRKDHFRYIRVKKGTFGQKVSFLVRKGHFMYIGVKEGTFGQIGSFWVKKNEVILGQKGSFEV